MRADARFALERLDPGDSARGPALHLEGVSYLLAGETDRADQLLAQAVEVATHDREPQRRLVRPGPALPGRHRA